MKEPQRHGPAVGACELPNTGYRGIDATLSRAGRLQKLLSESVEFVCATASGEQLNPDLRLKEGDRPAHCRLGHREMLGGFAKRAELRDRLEVPQLI